MSDNELAYYASLTNNKKKKNISESQKYAAESFIENEYSKYIEPKSKNTVKSTHYGRPSTIGNLSGLPKKGGKKKNNLNDYTKKELQNKVLKRLNTKKKLINALK